MGLMQKLMDKAKGKQSTEEKTPADQEENTNQENSQDQSENESDNQAAQGSGQEEEILNVILKKLAELSEEVNARIQEIESKITEVEKKASENEGTKKLEEEVEQIKKNLEEFTAVYEMISSQYNPLIDNSHSASPSKENAGHSSAPNPSPPPQPSTDVSPPAPPIPQQPPKAVEPKQTPAPVAATPPPPTSAAAKKAHVFEPEIPPPTMSDDHTARKLQLVNAALTNRDQQRQNSLNHNRRESVPFVPGLSGSISAKYLEAKQRPPVGSVVIEDAISGNIEQVDLGSSSFFEPQVSQVIEPDLALQHQIDTQLRAQEQLAEQTPVVPALSSAESPKQEEVATPPKSTSEGGLSFSLESLQGMEEPLKKQLIDFMIMQKHQNNTGKIVKSVAENQRFVTEGCEPFSNFLGLLQALNHQPRIFDRHVAVDRDHFAEWIAGAMEMEFLAEKLKTIKNKDEYVHTILSEL